MKNSPLPSGRCWSWREALRQSGQSLENARITDAGTHRRREKTREISVCSRNPWSWIWNKNGAAWLRWGSSSAGRGAVTAVSRAVVAGLDPAGGRTDQGSGSDPAGRGADAVSGAGGQGGGGPSGAGTADVLKNGPGRPKS